MNLPLRRLGSATAVLLVALTACGGGGGHTRNLVDGHGVAGINP